MQQQSGIMFNYKSPENMKKLKRASDLAFEYNTTNLTRDQRVEFLTEWLGSIGTGSLIKAPFNCDFGDNIQIGANTIINLNSVMFDRSPITIGDNVLVGPNCAFYTSIHPLDFTTRNQNMMISKPIVIGDNVWLGGNIVVMPGVTIGNGAVVGAGSVVTTDIPENCLALGNPASVVKEIDQQQVDAKFRT